MEFELTEQQQMFRDTVRKWVDREAPKSWSRQLEQQDEFPYVLWDKMTQAGFHGVAIPEELGGQGGDTTTQVLLARELARSLAGLTWIWGISSFACAKSVGLYGSEDQKKKYLPALADGNDKWAIAFTEPGGGTDVLGAMQTRVGRVEGGWLINGTKTFSTMASVADYLLLLARGPDDAKNKKRHEALSLFIVPADAEGVETRPIPKLGMRSVPSCEVFLNNVFVGDDALLGEPNQAWYMCLPTLNNERIVQAGICLGILDGVLEDALSYMNEREAFGGPIGRFQSLQHFVADIAIWRESAELMTLKAAWMQARGLETGLISNMARLHAAESATKAADLGIQILGGMGYTAETDMQRYWRDARLYRIGPISSEMARNSIAESLGLPRSF
jgi:acyl-CoA dehydrogenase